MNTLGHAELSFNGNTYQLPVVEGTERERAVDVSELRASSGLVTLDTGFKNTGATESNITFVDGEKGILRYRGYPIEDLAEKCTFLEVAHLLIYGELPNKQQLTDFKEGIKDVSMIHEDMKQMFDAFPNQAHPMAIMASITNALSTFYVDGDYMNQGSEMRDITYRRLLAKLPTVAAWAYKHTEGDPINYPNSDLSYADNLQQMLFAKPKLTYEIDPVISRTLETILILHADHEQNCSTSTVRLVGSSRVNLYTAISAGISALWGPLHGGANQQVMEMLSLIHKEGGNIDKWMERAKDPNDKFRLMGFGHRVYKNFDPRAKIIKVTCDELLQKKNISDPLLDIAKALEEKALADDYFIEKKLYPNVDFYSGIIYRTLGIPTRMFTVMFALGRLPGWIAQWKEMIENEEPIGRPRQIYTGHPLQSLER